MLTFTLVYRIPSNISVAPQATVLTTIRYQHIIEILVIYIFKIPTIKETADMKADS
jgi:hypothetical protein